VSVSRTSPINKEIVLNSTEVLKSAEIDSSWFATQGLPVVLFASYRFRVYYITVLNVVVKLSVVHQSIDSPFIAGTLSSGRPSLAIFPPSCGLFDLRKRTAINCHLIG